MRAGIDSYSYHRLLGELRAGETAPARRWNDGVRDVVDEAVALGAAAVSLQTSFVGPPQRGVAAALAAARERIEVALAWGAPSGLRYGTDSAALAQLCTWIELAASLGIGLVRIVLGGPADLGAATRHAADARGALERAATVAGAHGVHLAVENHGDIAAADLRAILQPFDPALIGVCFDTANALRVGDDVLAAAELLAPRTAIVHLKDVEDPRRQRNRIAGPCSVVYGTGVVPLAAALQTLRAGGFDGLACVEIGQVAPHDDERELVRSGLDWLAAFGV